MPRQSKPQKATVERVMHEFKDGDLKQKGGRKITDRKQAVAIALHEAGASKDQSPQEKSKARRKTAARKTGSKTAATEQANPAKKSRTAAAKPSARGAKARPAASANTAKTRADLYREATRRDIAGRSRMSKQELERALAR